MEILLLLHHVYKRGPVIESSTSDLQTQRKLQIGTGLAMGKHH
jgi:hypothetical protein